MLFTCETDFKGIHLFHNSWKNWIEKKCNWKKLKMYLKKIENVIEKNWKCNWKKLKKIEKNLIEMRIIY